MKEIKGQRKIYDKLYISNSECGGGREEGASNTAQRQRMRKMNVFLMENSYRSSKLGCAQSVEY